MSADPQRASQLTREGIDAGRMGDHATARQKLIEATRADPNLPDAWYYLSMFLENPDDKVKCLQRVLFLQPDNRQARDALEALQAGQPQTPPGQQTPPPQAQQYAQQGYAPGYAPPGQQQQQPPQGQHQQAFAQAGAAVGDAAQQFGSEMRKQLSGEQGRSLFRAWIAALRFDSERSYERFRGRKNVLFTAGLIFIMILLAGLALVLLALITVRFDMGALLRGLPYAALLAAQATISLYIASWVASYIGRIRFNSTVDTGEHFTLSGLFYVPMLLVIVVYVGLNQLITNMLGGSFSAFTVALYNAVAYTGVVLSIYVIGQFIYSNAAIHRVNAFPAVIISLVAGLAASLAFMWLLPITSLFA